MFDPKIHCHNCFKPIGGSPVCQYCGYDRTTQRQYNGVLPLFTVLNKGRYVVGRVLGKGGFGVTYVALDMVTEQRVAIKEYMPSEYSSRNIGKAAILPFNDEKSIKIFNHGKKKFFEEAQTLIRLIKLPAVVDILGYFDENNTAYLIMEYLDGINLRRMMNENGKKLDPIFAKNVFFTIARTLEQVHKFQMLHRDISPENIVYVPRGNYIKLIDFGSARNYVSVQNEGMSILLKKGFAPIEQYSKKGNQGPWTDVYALCSTFYFMVSGVMPTDAMFRIRGEAQPTLKERGCNVTAQTSAVIKKGMELDYKRRYQDFGKLLSQLDLQGVTELVNNPYSQPPQNYATNGNPSVQGGSGGVGIGNPNMQNNGAVRGTLNGQNNGSVRSTLNGQNNGSGRSTLNGQNNGSVRSTLNGQNNGSVRSTLNGQNNGSVRSILNGQNNGSVRSTLNGQNNGSVRSTLNGQNNGVVRSTLNGQNNGAVRSTLNGQNNGAVRGNPYGQNNGGVRVTGGQLSTVGGRASGSGMPATENLAPKVVLYSVINGRPTNPVTVSAGKVITIGRAPNCDCVIVGDTNISRIHCEISTDGRYIYITDRSANGTFFDNKARLIKGTKYTVNFGTRFYLSTPNHMMVIVKE